MLACWVDNSLRCPLVGGYMLLCAKISTQVISSAATGYSQMIGSAIKESMFQGQLKGQICCSAGLMITKVYTQLQLFFSTQ